MNEKQIKINTQANGVIYTHPAIKGEKFKTMLPERCALVLEGGGIRGFYSSGVFEAFMDAGIMFPYVIGVSAGAANALTYISGQRGRSRQIVEKYVGNHRYVGYRNIVRHGSMFGYDFIFKTVPETHIFWDRDIFDSTDIEFLTGTTDCKTGKTVWFDKQDITSGFDPVRASCSVPFISKIVKCNGYELLDGGISSPIPIEKSITDGNTFHVVVLTRNQGYIKPPFTHRNLLKLFYGKYPKFIEAMLNRHEAYNRQGALCEELERDGKAVIIRPLEPIKVSRTGKDIEKILELYDEGHREGAAAVERLRKKFMLR